MGEGRDGIHRETATRRRRTGQPAVVTRWAIAVAVIAVLLGGCGTATIAEIESQPSGALIVVQGVETGLRTPATLDLESYARDPDAEMTVEVRLDGYQTTTTTPYPPRHRCDLPVCEKKRRGTLPRLLPLLSSGTGVRIDATDVVHEVAIDRGPWIATDGPELVPGRSAASPSRLIRARTSCAGIATSALQAGPTPTGPSTSSCHRTATWRSNSTVGPGGSPDTAPSTSMPAHPDEGWGPVLAPLVRTP